MNPFESAAEHVGGWASGAGRAARRLRGAGNWGGRGGWRLASGALGIGSSYLGLLGAGNPTAWGATLGAGYGMASDDTSVIGGGLMGAGLGRYGGAAVLGGYGAFPSKAGNMGWGTLGTRVGKGAWRGLRRQAIGDYHMAWTRGVASKGFIGRTQNRAVNGWRALWA